MDFQSKFTKPLNSLFIFKKVLNIAALLILLAIIAGAIAYRLNTYDAVKQWYLALNGCFYRHEFWADKFFTAEVKHKGNQLALMGIGFSAVLVVAVLANWLKSNKNPPVNNEDVANDTNAACPGFWWHIAVIALGLVLGAWSWYAMAPAYDEIFSAVNCAALPPFQTLAYYMLPNNHIYFNFLNNILFSWWHDGVQTGRLISFTAYIFMLLCAYSWLFRYINNRLFAFFALIPIAMQFTVWAMAAQARGYEGQLCCLWIAFSAMLQYLEKEDNYKLKVNSFFNVLGFLLVPAYLSCYVAQVIIFIAVIAYNRRFQFRYFWYQFITVSVVFLGYLPAFCFSGIPAFTENGYVKPIYDTWLKYLPDFADTLKYFINFCFSSLCGEDRAINFVLFFLPLILFFSRRKERRLVAFCFTILWLTYIIITLNMRRNPNNRNMIMHYSVTLGCVLIALYALMEKAAQLIKPQKLKRAFMYVFFVIPVLAFCGHLYVSNKRDVSFFLYYNDVNDIYNNHIKTLTIIPKGRTIGFSYETFYLYYHFTRNHYRTVQCADGTEDYYIKRKDENLPKGKENDYIHIADGHQDYDFYKRK